MVHFRYLLDAGFLERVRDPAAAAERLMAIADGEDRRREQRQAFVRSFLRPVADGRTASRVAADVLVERFS